ncbi:MAG: serine protease [Myxococcales bacterium]|nr:serine protease [Myxococcales bacterium]
MWLLAGFLTALPTVAQPSDAEEGERWRALDPSYPDDTEVEPFTVVPLVWRGEDDGLWKGVTGEDLRIHLLEQAREAGWPVSGAENLLFSVDRSDEARFLLGGEITSVDDTSYPDPSGVKAQIRWELMDRRLAEVVYEVTTWGWISKNGEPTAADLLWVALGNVLGRPSFVDALGGSTAAAELAPGATLSTCSAPSTPGGIDTLRSAVVRITHGAGTGSGVVVSPDGFVMTAAHVVSAGASTEVSLSGGPTLPARRVRHDELRDVALLEIEGAGFPCAPLRTDEPDVGDRVHVVGYPLGSTHSSATAGIVSALQPIDGRRWLQTDAAVNPGSSGGPLFDEQGRVVGIVSAKMVGQSLEGLGYAVPTQDALRSLAVELADVSTVEGDPLHEEGPRPRVVDDADPDVSWPPPTQRVCVFRMGWDDSIVPVTVGRVVVRMPTRSYACISAQPGDVRVARRGMTPIRVRVTESDNAYVRILHSANKSRRETFLRVVQQLEEVTPVSSDSDSVE